MLANTVPVKHTKKVSQVALISLLLKVTLPNQCLHLLRMTGQSFLIINSWSVGAYFFGILGTKNKVKKSGKMIEDVMQRIPEKV